MLRSKQLLPFAKGARAWIVAGSVSKPTPLDGTGNGNGSTDDTKAEQGYTSTRTSQFPRSPPQISRAQDSGFRRNANGERVPISEAGKFEKLPKTSRSPFTEGQARASNGVVCAVSPSTSAKSLPGPSRIPVSDPDVVHCPLDKGQASDATLRRGEQSSDSQVAKPSQGVLIKDDSRQKNKNAIRGKAPEVGLASVSHISDQGPDPKPVGLSKIKSSDPDRSSLGRPSRGNDTTAQSVAGDKPVASKSTSRDIQTNELKAPQTSNVPARDPSTIPSSGSTPFAGSIKKSPDTAEPTPNCTITFGTIDAQVATSHPGSSSEVAGPVSKGNAFQSSVAGVQLSASNAQHQAVRHGRANAKSARSENLGAIPSSGGQVTVLDQSAGLSEGRQTGTGVSGGRKKSSSHGQGGAGRRTQRSARDFRGDSGSNDMVDEVGSILRRMGWTSETLKALASFNSKLNAFHINEVLKHQREPGLAWEFFNWAKRQSGYKHDVRTYTTMIGILGRVRDIEACGRLMDDMQREGCAPSVVTFNRLIHSYGKANYLGEALKLFQHMQEVGCEPDRVTYCTLIDLHAKAGFHDVAMDITQKMWLAGFQPDTFSYSLIIHCLGKSGNLPAAYKLFLEMIERGYSPNLVTYNIMIDLHAKAGKHHMALKLYNDMQDKGYRPDNVTYSVIMEVLGHSGHMDEAENVFIEMEQAGWPADATAYGSLVCMWGQTGNVRKATEWYKRMLDSGLAPNVPTCNSLLWAYLRVNDYEAAREVLDSMPAWGLSPTLPTYTLLLSGCTMCDNQDHVDATLQIMGRIGHPAHNFMCGLLNEGDRRRSTAYIHQFFDSLHGEELEIKRGFADALIEFLYKLDRRERAGSVWEVVVQKDIYPSAVSQRGPNHLILDLHVMSMGTAVVALIRTLAGMRERMLTTGAVPERIEIVTGWGKHSRVSGFSKIKNVVENVLGSLRAPFHIDSSNHGCFVGSGKSLANWLHQSEMGHMLAL